MTCEILFLIESMRCENNQGSVLPARRPLATVAAMRQDRPLLGIVLMLGFCVIAPLADAVAKLIADTVPLAELVFFRFAVQAAVLVPLMLLTGRRVSAAEGLELGEGVGVAALRGDVPRRAPVLVAGASPRKRE